jgi:hypothetical protein
MNFVGLVAGGLLAPALASAQTPAIQDYIDYALFEQRYCASCHQLPWGNEKQAEPKPGSLDALMAEALKNNPDIRVAEAKVRDAQAEFNRTRTKVVSDVTYLHAEIQAAQAMVDYAQRNLDRVSQLRKSNAVSEQVHDQAIANLQKAKVELALKQAKLPYLLGKQAGATAQHIDAAVVKKWLNIAKDKSVKTDEEYLRRLMLDLVGRLPTVEEAQKFLKMSDADRREKWIDQVLPKKSPPWAHAFAVEYHHYHAVPWYISRVEHPIAKQAPLPGSMTDKLRAALDKTVPGFVYGDTPAKEVLDYVRRGILPDFNLTIRAKAVSKDKVSVELKQPVPAGAALQYLEDELGVVFVVRDYGIVVVPADERLPPGAIRAVDFWKSGKIDAKEKK